MGVTLTYAELERYSAAFAGYLQAHTDLAPGDRIAVQMPNVLQYPIAVFGALRAGLIVVNTNPLYTPTEMIHQFSDSGAKALVVIDMINAFDFEGAGGMMPRGADAVVMIEHAHVALITQQVAANQSPAGACRQTLSKCP